MPQFRSFPSFQPDEVPWPEEAGLDPQINVSGQTSQPRLVRVLPTNPGDPRQRAPREPQQLTATNTLLPIQSDPEPAAPLYDVASTQSLIDALQSTLGGKTTSTRMPIV